MSKSVWGERPQMPRQVLDAVFAHAQELGRLVASDELFLLALTGLDEWRPARRALAAEGVDAERLRARIRVRGDRPRDRPTGMTFAPAYYLLQGRAEGFAAALGDGTITPEQVLLALLWDPESTSSQLVWRLGASREQIVARLAASGVPVPQAPLPVQREMEWGERVWFARDDVSRVLEHLRRRIPPGTRWGFNYEDQRAWAVAESSVDLEALVRAALTELEGELETARPRLRPGSVES